MSAYFSHKDLDMHTALNYFSPSVHQIAQEKKKQEIGLRVVRQDQVGQTLTTWQKGSKGLNKASQSVIEKDSVIARNLQIIGYDGDKAIHHEWLMTKEEVRKIFGQQILSQLNLNVAYYFQRGIIG